MHVVVGNGRVVAGGGSAAKLRTHPTLPTRLGAPLRLGALRRRDTGVLLLLFGVVVIVTVIVAVYVVYIVVVVAVVVVRRT